MAVTPTQLIIDGEATREVMHFDYVFEQETDIEGQLSGIPRCKSVTIQVKALNDGNYHLLAWMLDPTARKNIKIVMEKTTDGSTMKTIEGTNCYCTHYVEKWEEGKGHYEQINIVFQTLNNGGVVFDNPWK